MRVVAVRAGGRCRRRGNVRLQRRRANRCDGGIDLCGGLTKRYRRIDIQRTKRAAMAAEAVVAAAIDRIGNDLGMRGGRPVAHLLAVALAADGGTGGVGPLQDVGQARRGNVGAAGPMAGFAVHQGFGVLRRHPGGVINGVARSAFCVPDTRRRLLGSGQQLRERGCGRSRSGLLQRSSASTTCRNEHAEEESGGRDGQHGNPMILHRDASFLMISAAVSRVSSRTARCLSP